MERYAAAAAASESLRCPRCNSSNTKFCYYNNYNLSQPRHFCKACKRYWTRGGTLRNVPVGGGCRKNKKFKRHPPNNAGVDSTTTTALIKPSTFLTKVNPSPPSSNLINDSFFHSFPTELNFPFSATRVSSDSPRFDALPRISGPGLGFSHDNRNHLFERNSRDHSNCISFGSSSFAPDSTMPCLLNQHQRFAACNEFSSSTAYEDTQMVVGNGEIGKESRVFEEEIRFNQIEQMNSSDSSLFQWNSNNVGVWFDPSSSVPSLI